MAFFFVLFFLFVYICETRAFPVFCSNTEALPCVLFWWMKPQFGQSHYIAHLIHLSLPLFNSWINAASNKGLEIEEICHGRMLKHNSTLKSHPHIVTQKQNYRRAYSAHHPHQLFSVVIRQMHLCPLADITKQKKKSFLPDYNPLRDFNAPCSPSLLK